MALVDFLSLTGDYNEALTYYSRSISLSATAASINNRALCYLRLKRWAEAEKDCDLVLDMEPANIKAKLRRASALKEMDQLNESREDLRFVLSKVKLLSFEYSFVGTKIVCENVILRTCTP